MKDLPRILFTGVVVALSMQLSACASRSEPAPIGKLSISQSSARVLTTLRLAGSGTTASVVFDTGTSGNIIDRKLASKLGLPNRGASTAIDGSLGKPVPGFLTELKGASLGDIQIDDGPANAIDYDLPSEKGVFGPNSFPGKLVKMDLGRGLIVVERKTTSTLRAADAIPYIGQGEDALPSVIVDFGVTKIPAELDTGNNEAIILPLTFADNLSLQKPLENVGYAESAAGKQPLFRGRLNGQLRIGPLVMDKPDILFIAGGQPNVGLPVARQLVVVFDPSEKRSWLLSPSKENALTAEK